MSEEMKVDPARAKALVSALQSVSERVAKAAGGRNVSRFTIPSTFHRVHVTPNQMTYSSYAFSKIRG
jgi:hypothetical protein